MKKYGCVTTEKRQFMILIKHYGIQSQIRKLNEINISMMLMGKEFFVKNNNIDQISR